MGGDDVYIIETDQLGDRVTINGGSGDEVVIHVGPGQVTFISGDGIDATTAVGNLVKTVDASSEDLTFDSRDRSESSIPPQTTATNESVDPRVVYFGADGCGPCNDTRNLASELSERLMRALGRSEPLFSEYDTWRDELAMRHAREAGVQQIPTIQILSGDGRVLAQVSGVYPSTPDLIAVLAADAQAREGASAPG